MNVSDSRNIWQAFNRTRLSTHLQDLDSVQRSAITVLPLLFQVNYSLLPGYVDKKAACGIYGYKPTKKCIEHTKRLSKRFSYTMTQPLKHTSIDSLYLQKDLFGRAYTLWVFHDEDIDAKAHKELDEKLVAIILWLKTQQLEVNGILTNKNDFRTRLHANLKIKFPVSAGLLIDQFYAQSILLAGKYPAWWLVPADKEVDYNVLLADIRHRRFVKSAEYIDLGSIMQYRALDLLSLGIWYLYSALKTPSIFWLQLLILCARVKSGNNMDCAAVRIKKKIHGDRSIPGELTVEDISAHIVLELLSTVDHGADLEATERLINTFADNPEISEIPDGDFGGSLFKSLDMLWDTTTRTERKYHSLTEYLHDQEVLYSEIYLAFTWMLQHIPARTKEESPRFNTLLGTSRNILNLFTNKGDIVFISNHHEVPDLLPERVNLCHEVTDDNPRGSWSVRAEFEGLPDVQLHSNSDLLSVLMWGWMNRIMRASTTLSVKCPNRIINQVEVLHALGIISRHFPVDLVEKTQIEAFMHPVRMLHSIVLIHVFVDESAENEKESTNADTDPPGTTDEPVHMVLGCEQIVANSWGEISTGSYSGEEGVLDCITDWMKKVPPTFSQVPAQLQVYAYSSGENVYMAQKLQQLYDGTIQFFYTRHDNEECGEYILRLADTYYRIAFSDDVPGYHAIGSRHALMDYLQAPRTSFQRIALEKSVLSETPLREIYGHNRPGVLQLFYQVDAYTCHVYMLDEKGSLFIQEQYYYDQQSFLSQWVNFFENCGKRLAQLIGNSKNAQKLEIIQVSINQLGGLDFYRVDLEAIRAIDNYFDVRLVVENDSGGTQLTLFCNDASFSSRDLGEQLFPAFAAHVHGIRHNSETYPVYITDIDAPLELYGIDSASELQTVHVLRYKRNVESGLNKIVRENR